MAFNVAEIWRFISQSTSSAGCVCTKLSIASGSLFLCSSHYTTTHTLCVVLIYKHMGNLYIDGGAAHLTYPAAHVIGLVSYNINPHEKRGGEKSSSRRAFSLFFVFMPMYKNRYVL